jgi:hypothetical protein
MAQQPQWAKASSLSRIHYHSQTCLTRYDSSGRVTRPTQRPQPGKSQHSQETDIHASGGIRTHNPSKRAATNPRLKLCGRWDQKPILLDKIIYKSVALNFLNEFTDFKQFIKFFAHPSFPFKYLFSYVLTYFIIRYTFIYLWEYFSRWILCLLFCMVMKHRSHFNK